MWSQEWLPEEDIWRHQTLKSNNFDYILIKVHISPLWCQPLVNHIPGSLQILTRSRPPRFPRKHWLFWGLPARPILRNHPCDESPLILPPISLQGRAVSWALGTTRSDHAVPRIRTPLSCPPLPLLWLMVSHRNLRYDGKLSRGACFPAWRPW